MQARNATSGSGFNVAPHTNNAQTLNAQDRMALRQEAETIDTTIAALRARIIELKIRKKVIQDKLSTVVYPIHTLPAEIFCHIFQTAVSLTKPEGVKAMLLSITAVCQLWRSIALADFYLWTTTCYLLPVRDRAYHADVLFDHFLTRTHGLPIVVYVDNRKGRWLHQRLFESCGQWREAHLSVTGDIPLKLGLKTILNLPHLTQLTLDVDPYAEYYAYNTFSNAPRLQDLAISYTSLLSTLAFPLPQLRKLTLLRSATSTNLAHLLPLLVALEELVLGDGCNFNDFRSNIAFRRIELPFLTTLRLLGENSCALMTYLLLPHLASLHISKLRYKGEDSILECLSRSSGNITSLSLTNIAYPVFRLFLENPVISEALEDLTVTLLPMTHRENEALTIFLSRTNFLPRLESLTLGTPTAAGRGPSPTLRAIVDGLGQRVLVATSHNRRHEIILCTVSSTSTLL